MSDGSERTETTRVNPWDVLMRGGHYHLMPCVYVPAVVWEECDKSHLTGVQVKAVEAERARLAKRREKS